MPEFVRHRIHEALKNRKNEGLFRTLSTFDEGIDFSSNDYLGLARSEQLHCITLEELEKFRVKNGATGSRLLTGNSSYAEELEEEIARFHQSEDALLFNSGYSANLSVLATIPQKSDVILYDELCHASIREGIRLSAAKAYKFKHNNLSDLENKLSQIKAPVVVSSETVFSMDGDAPDLEQLHRLKKKFGFYLMLDEAHSAGLLGELGKIADMRIVTYGKAFGTHGAAVLCSREEKEFLINYARPLIYSTALAPHSLAAIRSAYRMMADLQEKRDWVQQLKTSFFTRIDSESQARFTFGPGAVCTLLYPGNTEVSKASAYLRQKNLDVRPVKSPTVSVGTERLRICFHAFNTEEEVLLLADSLNQLCQNATL